MSDLIARLKTRLDAEEAAASAAATSGNQFAAEGKFAPGWRQDGHSGEVRSDAGIVVFDEGAPSPAQADHIASQDPARTLRRVTAYRKILAEYAITAAVPDTSVHPERQTGYRLALEMAVNALATIYPVQETR